MRGESKTLSRRFEKYWSVDAYWLFPVIVVPAINLILLLALFLIAPSWWQLSHAENLALAVGILLSEWVGCTVVLARRQGLSLTRVLLTPLVVVAMLVPVFIAVAVI